MNQITEEQTGEVLGTFLYELAGIKVGLSVIDEEYKKKTETLKDRKKEIENELDRLMDQMDITSYKNDAGTASRKQEVHANIRDFEELVQFIAETGNYSLLKKSVPSKAYREMLEAGEPVPGVTEFIKSKVGFRVNATFRDSFIRKQGE